jgi:hypothetical protein
VATLLADSPPAPSDEPKAPDACLGAPQAPLNGNGAAPAPGAPVKVVAAESPHACARCSAPMAAGQDWCLQCGAGAPGSIGTPGWRSAATLLTATAVLAVGAAAAAYAALSKGTPATHMVTTTVAQATTPAATVPPTSTVNPLGGTGTVQPLIHAKVKPPRIPIVASKIPQQTTTTPTNTTGSKTTTTPTTTNTGGGTEPKSTAIVLDTNAASTYNPYNYPAGDFGDPSLTIDGDTSTAWDAQVEPAKAPNMAEGLLIDLKSKEKLGSLNIVTSTPGMVVQIYGTNSQTAPTSITDTAWVPLSHARVLKKKHAHIVLKDSTKAFNFITVWISKAPPTSTAEAPGHVSVNEVELFPAK